MATMFKLHDPKWGSPDYFRTFEEAVAARNASKRIDRDGEHPGAEYLVIDEVEREPRPCRFCGAEVQATSPEVDHCRNCHYSGQAATANRDAQVAFFAEATGASVWVEHTGGGCFWLAFRWEGETDYYVATDGEASLPGLALCPDCDERVRYQPEAEANACPAHGIVEKARYVDLPSGGWGYVGRHSEDEDSPDYDGTPIAGIFVGEYDPERNNAYWDAYPDPDLCLGDSDVVAAILKDRNERRTT